MDKRRTHLLASMVPSLLFRGLRPLLLLWGLAGLGLGCDGELGAGGSASLNQAVGTGANQTATNAQQASGNQTTGTLDENSAKLSWDANSESDLAGYKVYHSQESQLYTLGMPEAVVPVGTETHISANLAPGRHYFAVTAYDVAGNESALSVEVFKDIP